LILPAAPSPLIIVNLGAPFLIRAGTRAETMEHVDGCAVTVPTRAWECSYPNPTRTVGVHFRPWGLAPFLPMPTSDLCDRPATLEQIWRRQAVAELRYRLTLSETPHKMLKSIEDELMRRQQVLDGLDLVRQVSTALAETGGRKPAYDNNDAGRTS